MSEVKRHKLAISTLECDTSRFQFRDVDFDESRVTWLVENWDESKVDPLDIWIHEGVRYVLAGHHRLEAMRRLEIRQAHCRVHEFSEAEARMFALSSNVGRLEYNDFEYSACLVFLIESQEQSLSAAAKTLGLRPGMAKRYYSLRHLVGSDWEFHYTTLATPARAFAVGAFCDSYRVMGKDELQNLFKIVQENDLTTIQIERLLKDVRNYEENKPKTAPKANPNSLFATEDYVDKIAQISKERAFLDQVAVRAWYLFEMIKKAENHTFPDDQQSDFLKDLQKLYAYCVGSEDQDIIPTANTGGRSRSLRTDFAQSVTCEDEVA